MKLRVRFGELRFVVNIGDENATVFTLKNAICNAVTVRDISLINVSLNGTDVIRGDDVLLSSHGLVNGDLVYVISSAVPSQPATDVQSNDENKANEVLLAQLIEMGFDEGMAEHALVHVNNTSIDAALEFISGSQQVQATANLSCVQPETSSSHNTTKQTSCQLSSSTASQVMSTSSSVSHKKTAAKSEVINVPNPVFCRDGVSTVLESMYDKAGVKTQHEAMFVILHALMLESGFQSKNVSKDCKGENMICEEMPLGWNEKNASKLQYIHNLCPSLVSHMVFTSLGPFVYGHAWSSDNESGSHQVKLVVSYYIRGDVSLSSGAKMVYRNLHKVSRLVKDCLVHPLLATIRSHLGLTTLFSLIGLPPEIQLMIFSQLDATSVARLSCVCKGIRSVCNDENLWNFFCRRDFGVEETTFSSWKEQYKSLYRQLHAERCQEENELFMLPQPYPGIPAFNPFLPRLPPHFPSGIIGGPHDVFPDFINMQPQNGRRIPQHVPTDTHSAFRRRTGGTAISRRSFLC